MYIAIARSLSEILRVLHDAIFECYDEFDGISTTVFNGSHFRRAPRRVWVTEPHNIIASLGR